MQRATRSVNCRHSLEILDRLSFKIVSSERIRLPMFSNNYKNRSILIKVSNWDSKKALDRLKLQKVHFNSAPSDVRVTLDALQYKKHTERRSASENCIIDNTHCIVFSFKET